MTPTLARSGRRSLVFATLALLVAAMLVALPSLGLAQSEEDEPQPQPAYRFYGFTGSVTIDGEQAPHGTVIEAWANGEIVGRGMVRHGAWSVDVDYLSSGVTFTVNGFPDMGEPRDALVRGGQLRITLAVVSAPSEPEEEVVDAEDGNGTEMELETECPDADSMTPAGAMDSGDGMMYEHCPEADSEPMDDSEAPEETTEISFPNSGDGGLSHGVSGTALVAGLVFGLVVVGLVSAGVVRRRLRTSSRV